MKITTAIAYAFNMSRTWINTFVSSRFFAYHEVTRGPFGTPSDKWPACLGLAEETTALSLPCSVHWARLWARGNTPGGPDSCRKPRGSEGAARPDFWHRRMLCFSFSFHFSPSWRRRETRGRGKAGRASALDKEIPMWTEGPRWKPSLRWVW